MDQPWPSIFTNRKQIRKGTACPLALIETRWQTPTSLIFCHVSEIKRRKKHIRSQPIRRDSWKINIRGAWHRPIGTLNTPCQMLSRARVDYKCGHLKSYLMETGFAGTDTWLHRWHKLQWYSHRWLGASSPGQSRSKTRTHTSKIQEVPQRG